ncbi:hypothetical protein [Aureispira anguillae]|uniref:Uncharacterized protein n=1 Tax=Aureispira anguillae TaxID=2864201 RepID=A0A915YJV5_9BACT|nr:hypothetical protein [Aureispira anguillae]BDS14344.1 hypothetical protein AsAng_0051230 [Aureispira anguillae]
MNEEIYFLYKDLPYIQQRYIYQLFEKSTKMKRLIEVIESKGRHFKTVYAVNYIYSQETQTTDFKVLINRFYKLRQELKDWLLNQLKYSPVCFTDEEQELIYLKQLIINNEYTLARERLKTLEQICWEKNLFELLHQVIELRLRCIQASSTLGDSTEEELLEQYERAHELFMVLSKIKTIGFKTAYSPKDKTDKYLEKIKTIIRPYTQYPRFKLFYHYIAFSKRFASINNSKQVTSRHLNAFKKLQQAQPDMPKIFFERHYKERDYFYSLMKEAAFYSNMNEHKKALKLIKEIVAFEQSNKVYLTKNDGYMSNKFIIAMCAKDYDFAFGVLKERKIFQEVNNVKKHAYPFECILLDFYSQAFPFYTCTTEEINQWLTISFAYEKCQDVLYRGLRQFVHFKIYVITQEWEKAQNMINNPHSLAFYDAYGKNFDFQTFFQTTLDLLLQQDRLALQQYRTVLKQEKKRLKPKLPPVFWSWLTWAEQICQYHEKKLKGAT